jgi:hypothetical protein
MLGKKFRFTHNKTITWDVEVISETITHLYVKDLKTGRRWNERKGYFHKAYTEVTA